MKSLNDFPNVEEYNDYLRICFAGMALQGISSNPELCGILYSAAQQANITQFKAKAMMAVKDADALISELNKKQ